MDTTTFFDKYSKSITFVKGDSTFGLFTFGPVRKQFTVSEGVITRAGKMYTPESILAEYKEWKQQDKIRKAEEKENEREIRAIQARDTEIKNRIKSWGWISGGIYGFQSTLWKIEVEGGLVFVSCTLYGDDGYDLATFSTSLDGSGLTEDMLVDATLEVGKKVTEFWESEMTKKLNDMREAVKQIMPNKLEVIK